MNTRNICSKLKKFASVLSYDAVASGMMGYVEGFAFTGAVGGLVASKIFGTKALDTTLISAAGIGILGALEGLGLAVAAMYGKWGITGDYEEMHKKGFPYIRDGVLKFKDRNEFLSYLTAWGVYSLNHVFSGASACLALKLLSSDVTWNYVAQQIGAISIGTAATGWFVTPAVTVVTAHMLAKTYQITHAPSVADDPSFNTALKV
ncbi:MAG: hypothetical protein ACYCQI_10745 [Gammaproteobacteria bacterium]